MECVFCKIIKGEIPCSKVYEDDSTTAFLDIMPVNKGHTLVVPKEHFEDLFDIPEAVLVDVAKALKRVSEAVMKGTEAHGISIGQSNRAAAGQKVMHLHFHVMPRYDDDGLKLWPQGKYEEGEMEEFCKKIRERISH